MTPLFTAGTRPSSLQSESGLYVTDFSVKPQRTHDDVMGVAAGGSVPELLYTESHGLITDIAITGTPIPTAGGAYQGLAALEDADTIASLANIIDGEVFSLTLSSGTIISRDPEFKKSRKDTGREFTLNLKHCHAMS